MTITYPRECTDASGALRHRDRSAIGILILRNEPRNLLWPGTKRPGRTWSWTRRFPTPTGVRVFPMKRPNLRRYECGHCASIRWPWSAIGATYLSTFIQWLGTKAAKAQSQTRASPIPVELTDTNICGPYTSGPNQLYM